MTKSQEKIIESYRGKHNRIDELGDEGWRLLYEHKEVDGSPLSATQFLGYSANSRSFIGYKWRSLGLKSKRHKSEYIQTNIKEDHQHIENTKEAKKLLKMLGSHRDHSHSLLDICECLDCSPSFAKELIDQLVGIGYTIELSEIGAKMPTHDEVVQDIYLDWPQDESVFGFISDTHLCSKECDLAVLNAIYDRFEMEGITEVLHAGDVTDGVGDKGYRGHANEVIDVAHGVNGLLDNVVENYPRRKNIKTKAISGNHDDWEVDATGRDIMVEIARRREDIEYIGRCEANLLIGPDNKTKVTLFHPAGSPGYAISYRPQKKVESFVGGTKPHLLLMGHYHRSGMFTCRNVHTILGGCTQWSSLFMKRLSLEPIVGAWIIKIRLDPDGWIRELIPNFLSFYKPGS